MTDTTAKSVRPRRHVLRNTVFIVLSRMQGAVFTYLIIRLLLKLLSIEQYGLHSLLFIGVMTYMSVYFQFGMPNILNRFVPEFYGESRFGLIHKLFSAIMRVQFVAVLGMSVLTILLAEHITVWIGYPGFADVIRVFALGMVVYTISSIFESLLNSTFRQRTSFYISLVYNIARLGTLYIVTRFYPTFMAVVIVEIAVTTLRFAIFAVVYYRTFPALAKTQPQQSQELPWRSIRKFGGLSYLNEIGVSLLSIATDLLLVSTFAGILATGYYALANRIRELVVKVLPEQLLAPVVKPLFFSEYGSSTGRERSSSGFAMLMKGSLLLSLSVSICLAIMARPVVAYLFDARYTEQAGQLVSIMALFIASGSLRFPLALMIQNSHRVEWMIYAKVTVFVKIGLGIILLPKYGVIAMVWISELAVLLQNLILYYFIVSRLGHTGDLKGMGKIIVNGLLAGAILYLLRPFLDSLNGVFLSVVIFYAVYIGMNILHKPFRPEERDFINKHLPRPYWLF